MKFNKFDVEGNKSNLIKHAVNKMKTGSNQEKGNSDTRRHDKLPASLVHTLYGFIVKKNKDTRC